MYTEEDLGPLQKSKMEHFVTIANTSQKKVKKSAKEEKEHCTLQ